MSTAARNADLLVEEGLELYSRGRFDAALGKWREALLIAPEMARAIEYIDYVEGNRAALEQAYAENVASEGAHAAVSQEIAPFGTESSAPEAPSDSGSFFDVDVDVEEPGPAPRRGGAAAEPEQQHQARQRRNTMRSFAERLDAEPESADPFGADEPTPVSLIEERRASSPSPSRPRVDERTRDSLEELPDILAEEAPRAPQLRQVPPRPASPAAPRRRALGVPMPMPRDAVDAPPEVGAMPPAQPMRASQPTPSVIGLDEMLASEEAVGRRTDPGTGSAPVAQEVVVEAAPPSQSYEDLARRFVDEAGGRLETMLQGARDLYDQGTFEGSLWLCQKILGIEPEHADTLELLRRTQKVLLGQYEARLGDLKAIPIVAVSQGDIVWHKLDHRAGFLVSRIDGMLSFDDILDISGMDRFEAMRILAQLVEQGVVEAGG